jgi:hypothetical protein
MKINRINKLELFGTLKKLKYNNFVEYIAVKRALKQPSQNETKFNSLKI